jgi:hypothetical protein
MGNEDKHWYKTGHWEIKWKGLRVLEVIFVAVETEEKQLTGAKFNG